MKGFPDKFFDLALCDIPYGLNVAKMPFTRELNTMVTQRNGTKLNGNRQKKVYAQKEWDTKPPSQEYFDELVRVSKVQIIFGVEYVDWQGMGSGRIKWMKGVPEGMSFKKFEMAYCSCIDYERELPLLWSGMNQACSLETPMRQLGNKKLNEKRIHPTQKPVLLYQRLIRDYGFEECKIIDTHVGSGSSRIAAYKEKCDYYGWETDPDYWQAQEDRFESFLATCFPACW